MKAINRRKAVRTFQILFLFFGGIVMSQDKAMGKRRAPKEVAPVTYQGVTYTTSLDPPGGDLVASDAQTGKKLWDLQVYPVVIDPKKETDVQDVYITSLKIERGNLRVVNEHYETYEVDLKTRNVRIAHDIDALVNEEWERMPGTIISGAQPSEKPIVWMSRVTPPFPLSWPPNGDGKVVYYAYAYRIDDSLKDGEYIAAPWAKVLVGPGQSSPGTLENLSFVLKEIGDQGVEPINPEEVQAAGSIEKVGGPKLIKTVGQSKIGADTATALKKSYCFWQENSGIIAREIQPLHKAFFDWLACK